MANLSGIMKRDWSNVPGDIIVIIWEKLCWLDRYRLPFVCNSWWVLQGRIPSGGKDFPWLLKVEALYFYMSYVSKKFQLFDVLGNKSYVIDGKEERDDKKLTGFSILCSRCGWLLLGYRGHDPTLWLTLFSPLTNELITLPPLPGPVTLTTFSMSSTSPECNVFAISKGSWNRLRIYAYRLGDATWKTFTPKLNNRNLDFLDVTHLDRCFYILFNDGEIGVFNSELKKWGLLEQRCPIRLDFSKYTSENRLFVTSCRDLMLYDDGGQSSKDDVHLKSKEFLQPRIWRYDFLNKCWVHEQVCSNRPILRDYKYGHHHGFREFVGEFPLDTRSSTGYENIHYACDWLPEKIRGYAYQTQIIWFDQRLVWRKKDLLQPL